MLGDCGGAARRRPPRAHRGARVRVVGKRRLKYETRCGDEVYELDYALANDVIAKSVTLKADARRATVALAPGTGPGVAAFASRAIANRIHRATPMLHLTMVAAGDAAAPDDANVAVAVNDAAAAAGSTSPPQVTRTGAAVSSSTNAEIIFYGGAAGVVAGVLVIAAWHLKAALLRSPPSSNQIRRKRHVHFAPVPNDDDDDDGCVEESCDPGGGYRDECSDGDDEWY